jgi:hypothetical protein
MLCIVLNRVIAIQVWARGIAKKDTTMPVYQVSSHFKELKCYAIFSFGAVQNMLSNMATHIEAVKRYLLPNLNRYNKMSLEITALAQLTLAVALCVVRNMGLFFATPLGVIGLGQGFMGPTL